MNVLVLDLVCWCVAWKVEPGFPGFPGFPGLAYLTQIPCLSEAPVEHYICLLSNRIISFRYFTQIILLAASFVSGLFPNFLPPFQGTHGPSRCPGPLGSWSSDAWWLAGWLCTLSWLASSLANLSPSLTGCSLA